MGELTIVSKSSTAFSGRSEAGDLLACELKAYRGQNPAVLGVPRGGVVVALRIARALQGDLDMVLAHKLGAPGNPELAIGAVCEDGKLFIDQQIASYVGADETYIEREKSRQLKEIARRIKRYRDVVPKLPLGEKVVIVTDDGVATGATMQAALWAVRQEQPKKVVAALPVGPEDTLLKLAQDADQTICLQAPSFFSAISQFYACFNQVEDDELLEILTQESTRRSRQRE